MKRRTAITILLFLCASLHSQRLFAQSEQGESKRKVVQRVVPEYPDMARRMSLRGTVKVEAMVSSNGNVRSVEVRGGHPVLAKAAVDAVRKWHWEAAENR
jgi:TonB family protein